VTGVRLKKDREEKDLWASGQVMKAGLASRTFSITSGLVEEKQGAGGEKVGDKGETIDRCIRREAARDK